MPIKIKANSFLFVLIAGVAAFSAYFSMYAFRKPVTAATFESSSQVLGALDFKIAVILSQVLGYALSKWIGVRVISSHQPHHRGRMVLCLMFVSWLALIGFALLPSPWNLVMIFINSLPLGMIWGFVFAWVEGRRTTEILSAILCASFIFASGAVKSVGAWLMHVHDVPDVWMPSLTALIFTAPLLVSIIILSHLPPPSQEDIKERRARISMNGVERQKSLKLIGLPLALLVVAYILLTAFRDVRASFAAEIWNDLGYQNTISAFTYSEIPTTIGILVLLGFLAFVRSNRLAYKLINLLVVVGFCIIGLSTFAFQQNQISPMFWVTLTGAGLYLAYVPFGTILFDRFVAETGAAGNAGFLIYLADAFGYTASLFALLVRQFAVPDINWATFFLGQSYVTALLGSLFVVISIAVQSLGPNWKCSPSYR